MAASSASEDDVSAGGKCCVMHVISNTKSKFLNFSKRSWEKFISCAAKWKDIDELINEKKVVKQAESVLGVQICHEDTATPLPLPELQVCENKYIFCKASMVK